MAHAVELETEKCGVTTQLKRRVVLAEVAGFCFEVTGRPNGGGRALRTLRPADNIRAACTQPAGNRPAAGSRVSRQRQILMR